MQIESIDRFNLDIILILLCFSVSCSSYFLSFYLISSMTLNSQCDQGVDRLTCYIAYFSHPHLALINLKALIFLSSNGHNICLCRRISVICSHFVRFNLHYFKLIEGKANLAFLLMYLSIEYCSSNERIFVVRVSMLIAI
jgi:hypothetical protein